jgi:hypothetical protein
MTHIKIQKRRFAMAFKALTKGPSKGLRFKKRRWATKWEIAGGKSQTLAGYLYVAVRAFDPVLRCYESEVYPLLRSRKVREQFRTSFLEFSKTIEKLREDDINKFERAIDHIVMAETKNQVDKYRELGRKQRAKQKKQ